MTVADLTTAETIAVDTIAETTDVDMTVETIAADTISVLRAATTAIAMIEIIIEIDEIKDLTDDEYDDVIIEVNCMKKQKISSSTSMPKICLKHFASQSVDEIVNWNSQLQIENDSMDFNVISTSVTTYVIINELFCKFDFYITYFVHFLDS